MLQRGWRASCQGKNTGGPWTAEKQEWHIDYLEILAAFFGLKSFASEEKDATILQIGNVTTIVFLNKMGVTHSMELSSLPIDIWNWCLQRNIVIHAEHLPGKENVQADWKARHLNDSSDWRLNPGVFLTLEELLGHFSIDLFATRTNTQLPVYCSWRPDPWALAVDAYSIPWKGHYPYLFPPFALLPRCLDKIKKDRVTAVVIAPLWPYQIWFFHSLWQASPTNREYSHRSTGQKSHRRATRTPASSRMVCLGRNFRSEGLSEGVIHILKKSWRSEAMG